MAFRAGYAPLSKSHPEWGNVALLPWDEAIFGFPVADLESCAIPPPSNALNDFCARTGARLVSARSSVCDMASIAHLTAAGFALVDFSLLARLLRLKPEALPKPRFTLRDSVPEDHEAICAIAAQAFEF